MKIHLLTVVACIILSGFCSCKKTSSIIIAPVSVNIINAIPTSSSILPVVGTAGAIQYYSTALTIGYGGFSLYSPIAGAVQMYIVEYPDTLLVHGGSPLFAGSLSLRAGGIYSLFLAGDTIHVDTLFIQDNIPVYNDSSAGARFVNLSTGSLPVSVNIQGNPPAQQEVSSLAYKGVSSFIKYPTNSSIPGFYTFEIRDQASGNLLTTYTWYYTMYKNNTLVVSGSEDSQAQPR